MAGQYYLHRFSAAPADLNYDNPKFKRRCSMCSTFGSIGALTVFVLMPSRSCLSARAPAARGLPETHGFLRRLRTRAAERCKQLGREEVLLLAEAIQPVQEAMPYIADDELHSAFNFALTAHLFAAVAHGRSARARLPGSISRVEPGCRWALPLRNHDELWLGDGYLVPEEIVNRVREGFPNAQGHWLNWGINRRLSPLLNGDPRPNKALHALLYSLPGMPCIYYGDELGMGDYPGLRDRDANRTPMAWTAERNGGFSKAPDPLLVLPPITRPGYNCQMVNVAVQKSLNGSLLNWHRHTLLSRRLLPALRHGDFQLLETSHPGVISYIRQTEEMTVLVAVNLSSTPASTRLDLGPWQGQHVREVLGDALPRRQRPLVCVSLGLRLLLVVDRRCGARFLQQLRSHRRQPGGFLLIQQSQTAPAAEQITARRCPLLGDVEAPLSAANGQHLTEWLEFGGLLGVVNHLLSP